MRAGRSVNYALTFFIAIQLILCVIVLSYDRTLGASSGNSQSSNSQAASSNSSAGTVRRRASARRRSRRGIRTLPMDDSANNIRLNVPTLVSGQPIGVPANDNTPLDVTLTYIHDRMMEYGAQTGYSESEVIKRVDFADCSPPGASPYNNDMNPLTDEAATQPPSLEKCSISWVVAFKEHSAAGASEVTRTTTLRLKDLNTNNGAVIRQGVVWVRTAPYRSITVARPDLRTVIGEDEWWIDLHDEEVARRVARALQHAADLCRGQGYVEVFK